MGRRARGRRCSNGGVAEGHYRQVRRAAARGGAQQQRERARIGFGRASAQQRAGEPQAKGETPLARALCCCEGVEGQRGGAVQRAGRGGRLRSRHAARRGGGCGGGGSGKPSHVTAAAAARSSRAGASRASAALGALSTTRSKKWAPMEASASPAPKFGTLHARAVVRRASAA